jgi:hypothetical protein
MRRAAILREAQDEGLYVRFLNKEQGDIEAALPKGVFRRRR